MAKTEMSRCLHVIYCDDVRQEVGNKTSLIGIYGDDLFVEELPTVLPKLVLAITMSVPEETSFSRLSFSILRDDEQLLEFGIPEQDIRKSQDALKNAAKLVPPPTYSDPKRRLTFRSAMVLSPFVIEKSFTLRCIAHIDDDDVRGPALRIRLNPAKAEAGTSQQLNS